MLMPTVAIQHIELRPNGAGELRSFIMGTRVRVQDIYVDAEIRGKSPDEIVAAMPHLTLAQVHAALSYYFDHREEILDEMRRDASFVSMMKKQTGPGPLETKLRTTDFGNAVSSG